MHPLLTLLQGGYRRSIGQSNEAVARVLAQPELFAVLMSGIALEDAVLRMRCADAAEKISLRHPEWLAPYQRVLLNDYSRITQAEVRWHVAAMLPRLPLDAAGRRRVLDILLDYSNDRSSIVKTLAMQALFDLAAQDAALRPQVRQHIAELMVIGTAAMKARGRHLLAQLDRPSAPYPALVPRDRLEDLPNIGARIAADLRAIGIQETAQLAQCDALNLYRNLAATMGKRHDPCVLYTLLAAQHYLRNTENLPWWKFTAQGKQLLHEAASPHVPQKVR